MLKEKICFATGIIGANISAIYGGWTSAMTTLLIFMGIDVITGFFNAAVFKNSKKSERGALSSYTMWKGLVRKAVSLLIVLMAHRIDVQLKTNFVKDAVCIAFITSEGLSIIENATLMGVPVPAVVSKALDMLKKEGEKNAE